MVYDPKKFKEIEMPKIGTSIKGKVTDLNEGILRDFLSPDILEKWDKSDPESKQLEVVILLENGQTRKKLVALPDDGQVFPSSNMGKWKKTFGAYPHIGQEVFLIVDAEGFPQFKI